MSSEIALLDGTRVRVPLLKPACIAPSCAYVATNLQRLKQHLVDTHADAFAHLALYVCVCDVCRGARKFYDRSHACAKHGAIPAYAARKELLVPVNEFVAYVPSAEQPQDAPVRPPPTAIGLAFLTALPPLGSHGHVRLPDGTEVRQRSVDVASKQRFVCTEAPSCTLHFSTAQSLRAHLLDAHNYLSVGTLTCACAECAYARVYVDKNHALKHHRKITAFDASVHLLDARSVLKPVLVKEPASVVVECENGAKFTFIGDTASVACSDCGALMHSTKHQVLRNHVTSVHGVAVVGGVVCDVVGCACGRPFADMSHMMAHVKSLPEDAPVSKRARVNTYTCDSETNTACACGELFSTRDSWDVHVAKTTGARYYECLQCGKQCTTQSDLRKHELTHDTSTPFACSLDGCTFVTTNAVALRLHQTRTARHRDDAPLPCKCVHEGCTYAAQYQCMVDTHAKNVHTDDRPYVCEDPACPSLSVRYEPAAFKTVGDLRKHEENVHASTYDVPCDQNGCTARFKTVRHMHLHLLTVHCEPEFACDTCGAKFRTKAHMLKHELTHSDERPLSCSYCGDTFKHKYCLDSHIAWVHEPALRYPCSQCDFLFTSPSRRDTHENVHARVYTSCQSKGEETILQALRSSKCKFLYNYTPTGRRVRFDFVLEYGVDAVAIEYDGNLHFAPFNNRVQHVEAFFWQVSRDLLKSRLCRSSSIRLIRITGKLPSIFGHDDLVRMYLARAPAAPFEDYVEAAAFTFEFANVVRRMASATDFSSVTDRVSACGILILAMKDANIVPNELHFDEDDAQNLCDAVLVVFLRNCMYTRMTVEDVVSTFGQHAVDACICIARSMPEFAGTSAALAPFVIHEFCTDAKTATLSTAAKVAVEQHCWLCDDVERKLRYGISFADSDAMLAHLNTHHPIKLLVSCKWCNVTFMSQSERRASAGHRVGCQSLDRTTVTLDIMQKTSNCGLCGFTSTAPFRLLRHFNESHDSKFSQWATLTCDVCGNRSCTSVGQLVKHHENHALKK